MPMKSFLFTLLFLLLVLPIQAQVQRNSGETNGLLILDDLSAFEGTLLVGEVSVNSGDFEDDEYTYTLLGEDADRFEFSEFNKRSLSFVDDAKREDSVGYELTVRATEPDGDYIERDFTILLKNFGFPETIAAEEIRTYYEVTGNVRLRVARKNGRAIRPKLTIEDNYNADSTSLSFNSSNLVSNFAFQNLATTVPLKDIFTADINKTKLDFGN